MIDAPPEENVGAGPAVVLAALLTCFFKPPMDTDKHEYRNLHSRLFASIRGSKFSHQ